MTIVPPAASLVFGDYQVSFRYLIVIVSMLVVSAGLMRLPPPKRI
jgi:hypothetical protein